MDCEAGPAGSLPDHNRKSSDQEPELTEPIKITMIEHFADELRACASMLGGRAWHPNTGYRGRYTLIAPSDSYFRAVAVVTEPPTGNHAAAEADAAVARPPRQTILPASLAGPPGHFPCRHRTSAPPRRKCAYRCRW